PADEAEAGLLPLPKRPVGPSVRPDRRAGGEGLSEPGGLRRAWSPERGRLPGVAGAAPRPGAAAARGEQGAAGTAPGLQAPEPQPAGPDRLVDAPGASALRAKVPRAEPPLPPKELMARVGREPRGDLEAGYLSTGSALKSGVVDLLGPDWSWEGRRVLDFGCGSGRLLRQFNDEARVAEVHGSRLDQGTR